MSDHLGKTSFLDTPDVNGVDVLTKTSLLGTTDQIVNTNGVLSLAPNLVLPGAEGFVFPTGTTAQRPVSPIVGEQRYNTTLSEPEVYSNGNWLPYARIVQTVSGSIPAKTASIASKTTTTIPLTTEGTQIWTTSFTPLVAGSSLVIQYVITIYHTGSTRGLWTAAYVGTGAVGMSIIGAAVQATGTAYAGTYNISMQSVYTTVSTATVTISANAGHALATSAAAVTVGINQATVGSFGGAMVSEYRILEII